MSHNLSERGDNADRGDNAPNQRMRPISRGTGLLQIKDGKCEFGEGLHPQPDLTIKTPSEIWLAIANKEIDGQQAYLEGKYTAEGNMALMINLRNLFGRNLTVSRTGVRADIMFISFSGDGRCGGSPLQLFRRV